MNAPSRQLLKWIGNKHRVAPIIAGYFPSDYKRYYEPFVGSAAVLGTLAPRDAVASDVLAPLVQIWQRVQANPQAVYDGYQTRFTAFTTQDRKVVYRAILDRYNATGDPDDLLFVARTCYGGVIRFDKQGVMNTPCGIHRALPLAKFADALRLWQPLVAGTRFVVGDFEAQIDAAGEGDLVYCDPPYQDCGKNLYGAQTFSLQRLFAAIERAVKLGRSMLRRFQMAGQSLESEHVADRLLTTW